MAIFRRKPLPFSINPTITSVVSVYPLRRSNVAAIAVMASGLFAPPFPTPNVPTVDRTLQAWSEPVRLNLKHPLHAAYHPATFQVMGAVDVGEAVLESKWHQPWSEPRRFKKGLAVYLQPFKPFEDPANTTLPKRTMPWFAPFSEPKRFKPGLAASAQDFYVLDFPPQPPVSKLIQWFSNLSEPVRLKIGLKAWLQMTTAWEPRLLPTPNITATMAATETNADQAEIVYVAYGTPTGNASTAKVSITEGPPAGATLSMSET